jgi:phosphoribosylformylglycinamidine synthase
VALADSRLLRSAHDCSEGGVAVAIAECCFENGGIGAEASIDSKHISRLESIDLAAALFSESATRVVVSVAPANVAKVLERAEKADVAVRMIGRVGGSRIRIAVGRETAIDVPLAEAERTWSSAIEQYFAKRVA